MNLKGPKILQFWEKGKAITKEQSPAILAGLAVVGVISTAYCAWKAAPRYEEVLERHKEDMKKVKKGDKEAERAVKKETAKDLVIILGPMIISLGASIGMIIGSQRISARRITALSAAYTLSSDMVKDLNQQMKAEFGPKKTDQVKQKVMEKRVRESNDGDLPTRTPAMCQSGLYWCRDYYTGQMFQTSSFIIGQAIVEASTEASRESYTTLKDFYYALQKHGSKEMENIFRSPIGDQFGWLVDDISDGSLPISYTAVLADDGSPILALEYEVRHDYDMRDVKISHLY